MLTLTVGTYAVLEKHLARRLAALADARGADAVLPEPVTIVAPSRALIRHLTRALPAEHGLAFSNVRFHTFQSLARAILAELDVPACSLAEEPLVEERMAAGILEAGEGGGELKRLSDAPGLFQSLLGTVRDLEEAGLDPDELAADPAGPGAEQIRSILPLLRRLRQGFSRRGLKSRTDVIREAAARAHEARCISSLSALIYYGAYDLTQHQLDFLIRLAEEGKVEVLFPARVSRPGRLHPAHRFAESTLALIGQKAGRTEWLEGEERGPLAGLMPQIMAGGKAPPLRGIPDKVEVWRTVSPAGQWETIARECRRLVEEEDWRPDEIAVVARSLEGPLEAAAAAFRKEKVEFTCGFPVPLMSLPAGRALAALADALSGDFSPEVVLEAATSAVTGIGPEGLRRDRARAMVRRMWSGAAAGDWESLAGEDEETAKALKDAVRRLAALASEFPEREFPGAYARRLLDATGAVIRAPQAMSGIAEDSAPEAFTRALTRLLALERMGEKVSREEFFRIARQTIEEEGARIYEREAGVRVMDAMEARGVSARAVFLADLTEGAFPRVSTEDPFLRDPARRHLNEVLGFKIQIKGVESPEEERLLFHNLLDAATERLYLVWHPGEVKRPALVSSLLTGALEDLGLDRVPDTPTSSGVRPIRVEGAARDLYGEGSRCVAELEDVGRPAGPRDGVTGFVRMPADALRATGLVEWAKCPFRAYALLGLKIRPPRGPRGPWEPEGSAVGIIVHEALSEAVKELRVSWDQAGDGRIERVCRDRLATAVDRHLPEFILFPVLRDAIIGDWAPLLADLLERDYEWCRQRRLVPEAVELDARGVVAEGNQPMKARGRIDRLDSGPGVARLIDYKSHLKRARVPSRPTFSPEFYQLALYRSLLGDRAGNWVLSVGHLGRGVGGVKFAHAEGDVAGEICSRERSLSAALSVSIASGAAWPFPKEKGKRPGNWRPDCDMCEFMLVCRRDHGPTQERLSRDGVWTQVEEALGAGAGEDEDE